MGNKNTSPIPPSSFGVMMPQGQHVEHNIRLKPLQTIEGNHTRSTRNSFATSNLSLVGTSPNEGRIAPSSERLLATRAIRSNGHNEDFNRRQSLSQRSLDIDLEASLTPVQLDSETRQNDENAIDISKIQAKKAQHSKFNTASIQSVLLRAITFLYKTSCRVVDVSNNEDVSKMHEKTDSLVINSSTASISTFETPSVSSHTVESSYCQNAPRPDEHFLAIVVRKTLYCKWTQPFILFLIMLQTVLLLVETTGQGAYNGQRIFSSSTLWRNVCYLVIFFLYTAELACKGAVHWLERGEATPIESRLSLRNLFNTLDVVAVVSFWINLIIRLALPHQIRLSQVLAMLSGLRILRLLRVTAGTDSESTVIFEALKESGARLAKVASFICFFWLIFAVVGIQMFKSSLKRSCVLVNTDPIAVKTAPLEEIQFCGGHLAASVWNEPHSWIKSDGSPGAVGHRGYLCPRGMVCQEGTNPYNDTVSFDNIFQSLELVFVIFSANTFSTLMYSVMDSNGLAAALFFAVVIVVLYFWLVILLVGVITGSIQEIRQRLRIPATAQDRRSIQSGGQPKTPKSGPGQGTTASVRKAFRKTKWFWIMIIAYNLVAQAQRVSGMSVTTEAFIDYSESVVTWILLLEIILRFALDWRTFHHSKQNLADLGLAIVTSIMQVPFVQKSGRVFTWLKAFQVSRSYRIFWAINPVRDIIMVSFNYFPGLLQLSCFLFLLVLLASVLATQMFKNTTLNEVITNDEPFLDLWKSFLGMYQIFTGEDWTKHLYAVTQRDSGQKLGWIGAIFIIGWFMMSSIIILNMFLSRIEESLNMPDDRKRIFQVGEFYQKSSGASVESNTVGFSQVGRENVLTRLNRTTLTDTHLGTVVAKFLGDHEIPKQFLRSPAQTLDIEVKPRLKTLLSFAVAKVRAAWRTNSSKIPFQRFPFSTGPITYYYRRFQEGCRTLLGQDGQSLHWSHCKPGDLFNTFIYMSIISQIVITCVTTPLYQRDYFQEHMYYTKNWFVLTDLGFAILWSIEAVVKITAGGLVRGPNAYLRGWNLIDAVVLFTSWCGIALALYNVGRPVAALISSFKAFRVLRLLTINKKVMREVTFVFRRGSHRVFACILVSLSLLVPFAVFGLILFEGRSKICNDSNILNHSDCVGEFVPLNRGYLLAPRVVSRPYYSFDTFGQSFYTLFLIVSQEGWTEVMYWARGVSADSQYPGASNFTSNMDAMFFVIFNFCGTIFVTALFASVMIQNYTEATGVAYMTNRQRAWAEQKRLLQRVHPSRRPPEPESLSPWRRWCYDLATKKGKWQKFVIATFTLHLLLLCVDFYPSIEPWERVRDGVFIALLLVFAFNITIRIVGFSVQLFIRRPWDILGLLLVSSGLATSLIHLFNPRTTTITYINQILRDAVILLMIPYIPAFGTLFNVAMASIPLVSTLLVTWFVLLLFFAIGLTQAFGLTRFGPHETGNVNFRNIPKALILLFRMTLGEGRTKIMEDFAAVVSPYCTVGERFFESDCGDAALARIFFISWKVLSTYLFTSLFISLVYESFSHVYRGFSIKTGTITRDDIRQFKDAWAVVDPKRTGYIPPESLSKFMSLLSGRLSMRVYEDQFTIPTLRRECKHKSPPSPVDIDLGNLNARLKTLPIKIIREKRQAMNRLRMELLLTKDLKLGISIQTALITIIYYNLLDTREYLKFEEYLERDNLLREVDRALSIESVTGFIKIYQYKRALNK